MFKYSKITVVWLMSADQFTQLNFSKFSNDGHFSQLFVRRWTHPNLVSNDQNLIIFSLQILMVISCVLLIKIKLWYGTLETANSFEASQSQPIMTSGRTKTKETTNIVGKVIQILPLQRTELLLFTLSEIFLSQLMWCCSGEEFLCVKHLLFFVVR